MPEKKMKHMVACWRPQDLRELGYLEFFQPVERVTVLSPIALMPEKTAILAVIKWKAGPDLTWLNNSVLIEQVMDMGAVKDGRMYLILGREDPWYFELLRKLMEELRVFIHWPITLEPDRTVIGFIGHMENIAKLMEVIEGFDVRAEVLSIRDYDPSISGPLESLTPRQYEFLKDAFEAGHYDDERGRTINELAREHGVSPSSYMKTLRRAQRKVIGGLLDKGGVGN